MLSTGSFRHLASIGLLVAGGLACTRNKTADAPTPEATGGQASLLWVMTAELSFADAPRLFEITVAPSSGVPPIRKAGDLPLPGQTVRVDGLPGDPAATITGSLYRRALIPADRTHACAGEQPVALMPGQATSVTITCTSVTDPTASPIRVLIKVAQINLTIAEQDPAAVLAARDFTRPSLFSVIDAKGRRITLKQDQAALTVHVGGEVSYLALNDASLPSPLLQLLGGATLDLEAVAGQSLQALPESATLTLNAAPLLYEPAPGELAAVLPIKLDNAAGTLAIEGRLFEEPASHEITVVSYNVENLFDQVDEDRNAGYGDYRITPNADGRSSNYGDLVSFEGRSMTFTDVKIAGIRKTLIGLDPAGPEVVGLVEIESRAALESLLDATRDLGYVNAVFSDWAVGMSPTAIGMGVLTKLPVLDSGVLTVATPETPNAEASRPILKVTLDVAGHPLIVYVNHWKSKGGPESQRILYAQALEADIQAHLALNAKTDYIILGDLNSEYNERVIIEAGHDDAGGLTGINDVLHAQGDELAVLRNGNPLLKYNLQYELNKAARRTAWHAGFEWSALDSMIIGSGMYDQSGLSYVDGSFQAVTALMPRLPFLFNADGTTNRWRQVRESSTRTRHEIGGYSDHLPIYARFRVPVRQSNGTIWLGTPGKPDGTDLVAP